MEGLQKLNLPEYQFNIKDNEILDKCRKKYVKLTPEEWVRQNIIEYLVHEKGFPRSLISVEKEIRVNRLRRRPDIVVYRNDLKPVLMVECKAPAIKITQEAFDQVVRYNISLQLEYLIVTNGMQHYCCQMDLENNNYTYLQSIPDYKQL